MIKSKKGDTVEGKQCVYGKVIYRYNTLADNPRERDL
jgi:hypothetical protein